MGAHAPNSIYLQPGALYVSPGDEVISTILGSCVAVCLWDPVRGVGGMNHFLMPQGIPGAEDQSRYGNTATRLLVDRLGRLGSGPRDLQALLFGGACVISAFRKDDHLGLRNVAVARQELDRMGIRILDEDIGGTLARRVQFHVGTGATSVRSVGGM